MATSILLPPPTALPPSSNVSLNCSVPCFRVSCYSALSFNGLVDVNNPRVARFEVLGSATKWVAFPLRAPSRSGRGTRSGGSSSWVCCSLPVEKETQVESAESLKSDPNAQVLAQACQKIRQMAKQGNLRGALEEMDTLQALGIEPDLMVATALVDCCIRSRELAKAEKAFNAFFSKKSSLRPDNVAFGVLLGAYGKQKPPQWAKMERLIGRMEEDFGIEPTVSEFNELIDACARENHLEKGVEVIDRMKAFGIQPNEETFSAVKRRRALRSHFRRVFAAED